jgi:nicotinamidase-related amidase
MAAQPPVLLLIDLQHSLVEAPAEWGPRSTPTLTENVAHLLHTWRSRSWPILHVYHDELEEANSIIRVGVPESFKPHACSAPLPSEPQFVKHVGSALIGMKLQEELEKLEKGGKRKIVVIGMDAGQCVSNTVRHGADLRFQMLIAADATAAYGAEDWRTGKQLPADQTWEAALSVLTGCAKVVETKDLLPTLGYE